MTMTFSLHDSIAPNEYIDVTEKWNQGGVDHRTHPEFRFFSSKLVVPGAGQSISRPRLVKILENAMPQFPATLISGRSGTGKTTLAAELVKSRKNVAWLSVDSSDSEWPVFARYFSECVRRGAGSNGAAFGDDLRRFSVGAAAEFLAADFAAWPVADTNKQPGMLVLDDVHHVFDAEWFNEFFQILLYSLPSHLHLLMLCRSKPPGPLWRLRSKQMLNVLDEKQIAFTLDETEELFTQMGLAGENAAEAHRRSFGRISSILEFVRNPGP